MRYRRLNPHADNFKDYLLNNFACASFGLEFSRRRHKRMPRKYYEHGEGLLLSYHNFIYGSMLFSLFSARNCIATVCACHNLNAEGTFHILCVCERERQGDCSEIRAENCLQKCDIKKNTEFSRKTIYISCTYYLRGGEIFLLPCPTFSVEGR